MRFFLILFFIVMPQITFAGEASVNYEDFSLLWIVPFIGMILSIAIFPLIAERFWHHHFGKIALFWALLFLLPFISKVPFDAGKAIILHTVFFEYIPFIILLFSLFVVSGGVRLVGTPRGGPLINLGFLAFGTCIASLMGTTGAAMLLIRPLIRANDWRKYSKHIYIFFIFLVANVGGALSPLGDPPLFLGFLQGVDFFWPLQHLWPVTIFVSLSLLSIFFFIELRAFKKEPRKKAPAHIEEKLSLDGAHNILFIFLIAGCVLLNGVWQSNTSFHILGQNIPYEMIASNFGMLLIAFLSWMTTSIETRTLNGFSWFPIVEVAKLFASIFLTIIPVLGILKLGADGKLGFIMNFVNNDQGQPISFLYFWVTGILSGFLDNAPTYLVFFNSAGGNAEILMTSLEKTLIAISAGAVFMGAMTYVGNAPNFMVRSIVEDNHIKMPGFFGYMLWSLIILLPVLVLADLIFIA